MKPWEIWTFDFTEEDSHPAVIISNQDRIDNPHLERVNVLLGRSPTPFNDLAKRCEGKQART